MQCSKFWEKWDKYRISEIMITLIIGAVSIFVACKANKIAEVQTLIARNTALPVLEVEEKIRASELLGGEESSCIEVSNLDGRMNKYNSRIVTFLICEYANIDENIYKECSVPVNSYYYVNSTSGAVRGLIDYKESVGNYAMIENLEKAISEFRTNNQEQAIYIELKSYLEISYEDLLNEEQKVYYLVDFENTTVLDLDEGEKYFRQYDVLLKEGYGINTNRTQNISVEELVDIIMEMPEDSITSNIETDQEGVEETKMSVLYGEMIIGAIFGVIGSLLVGNYFRKRGKEEYESLAAALLFYDLKSIENYLKYETLDVNLRYFQEWQKEISRCPFLKKVEIEKLYGIYDRVYNYNYCYERIGKEDVIKKNKIKEYDLLYREIFQGNGEDKEEYNEKYCEILKAMQEHMK